MSVIGRTALILPPELYRNLASKLVVCGFLRMVKFLWIILYTAVILHFLQRVEAITPNPKKRL